MPEDFLGMFRSETDVVTLQPGQELIKKGDAGSHMYVVKSGEVQVLDGNHVFETVSAGGILGEMALISEGTRSATARAVSESVIVPVDQKQFLFLVQQTPFFAIRVMSVMSARLRIMNDWVTSLPEKIASAQSASAPHTTATTPFSFSAVLQRRSLDAALLWFGRVHARHIHATALPAPHHRHVAPAGAHTASSLLRLRRLVGHRIVNSGLAHAPHHAARALAGR